MTIAVAIKTGSAVVFAADSKLTTRGIVGVEEDGSPRWQNQTYDHANKIVSDQTETLMAMVAGHANIGLVSTTDFLSTHSFTHFGDVASQDQAVQDLTNVMVQKKQEYWSTTQVEPEKWPGPVLLLSAPAPSGNTPRVWQILLNGKEAKISEILPDPGIRLEGSYNEVFCLLYGYDPTVLESVCSLLGVPMDKALEATKGLKVLRPIDKLNLWAMPVQDAIDLAVFIAQVQVQMDRYLPGEAVCGGPIDVMVLQMAPQAKIRSFPGKIVHHPLVK